MSHSHLPSRAGDEDNEEGAATCPFSTAVCVQHLLSVTSIYGAVSREPIGADFDVFAFFTVGHFLST